MEEPRKLTARYVVRESDLTGMKWDKRQRIIEEAQRYVQSAIGHQIVRALIGQNRSGNVSLQYSISQDEGGREVVITYVATVSKPGGSED